MLNLTDSLYQTLCVWWDRQGFQKQSRSILPETSWVSFVGEKPVFFVSLYHHCGLGILTWPTMNPDADSQEREEAFSKMMDHVDKVGKGLGLHVIITGTSNNRLTQRLSQSGFIRCDEGVVHLMKVLKEESCRQH